MPLGLVPGDRQAKRLLRLVGPARDAAFARLDDAPVGPAAFRRDLGGKLEQGVVPFGGGMAARKIGANLVLVLTLIIERVQHRGVQVHEADVRGVLALACAICETRLFTKINKILNPRVGILYMMITATSPGFFHASIDYLPSSFAMYFVMLSTAAFIDWRGGLRTVQGVVLMAVGALLGWPFAAAMIVPFLVEEALNGATNEWEDRLDMLNL